MVLNHVVFTRNSILTAEQVAKIFELKLIDSNQDFYDINHRKEVQKEYDDKTAFKDESFKPKSNYTISQIAEND